MSDRKRQLSSKLMGAAVTRRQFVKLAGVSVAAAGVASWPNHLLFAAQPARKRIVIHGERQVTSLGYHNRRETEHVSMVDAGLVTQNPVTLERVPVLAEELPSVKKGTWKIDTQRKTMVTVYKLRPGLTWHDGKPYTSKDFEFGWQIAKHPEFPMPDRLVPELISKIETPDDRTIVIHWNDLYNEAYAIQYTHVRAFPRHIYSFTGASRVSAELLAALSRRRGGAAGARLSVDATGGVAGQPGDRRRPRPGGGQQAGPCRPARPGAEVDRSPSIPTRSPRRRRSRRRSRAHRERKTAVGDRRAVPDQRPVGGVRGGADRGRRRVPGARRGRVLQPPGDPAGAAGDAACGRARRRRAGRRIGAAGARNCSSRWG